MKITVGTIKQLVRESVDPTPPIVNSWMIQMRRAVGDAELLNDMAAAWDEMAAAKITSPEQRMQVARKIAAEHGLQPSLISFHISKVASYAASGTPVSGADLKQQVLSAARSRADASAKSANSQRRAFELAAQNGIKPDNSYEYAEGGAYYREKRAYDAQIAAIQAAYDAESDTFNLQKYEDILRRD